jgi:bifunctional non-homologous end joining protein LigD
MPPRRTAPSDPLALYRAKRSADRTPEPSGAAVVPAAAEGRLFVVHKHAATRLHFDLRLQMEAVLRSWAVPKGPSKNSADKRLAVLVEDHPLEYGDFEGIIPEGNYGAGAVIVWDRGAWVPIGDPREGLEKGKLLFDLRGYKLRGRWTLVKIKTAKQEWLLIKERDGYVERDGDAFPQGSVLSGLTVEELRDGADPGAALAVDLARAKVPRKAVRVADVTPMLAETREAPFSKAGWLFELKLDGYRALAAREGGRAALRSRNGNDLGATFPEVVRALEKLPFDGLILDGEIVVHDERGLPAFQRLQQRGRLTRPIEVRRAAVDLPATLYVFDCLAAQGHDLRGLPLTARKEVLRRVLPAAGALKFLDHVEEHGEGLYAHVERMGLEGIVAKKADSPYRMRRSADWVKVRAERVDDFAVVGFSRPKGSRTGFGALHLATHVDGQLTYAGRVGSGFTDPMLAEVAETLEAHRRDAPPCIGRCPPGKGETWVEPTLVAEVRFREWTDEGLLRQPVFLRFRSDKEVGACERAGSREGGRAEEKEDAREGRRDAAERAPSRAPALPLARHFALTNLSKVFWPAEGYTKGDLVAYYRAIARWMLPYLHDRPLVLTRYPDGIEGKSFFQKDAPGYAREFVRTVTIWSEESERELDYFVCEAPDDLVYIANMGAIPLHIWGSRVSALETPDWCILDLDPKGAPFAHVIEVAQAVRAVCDDIAMPCYVKTSGSSGLHVLLPMGRQVTYEQARALGGLLAKLVARDLPAIATVVRQVQQREGKVYLDWLQNGHGRLLAAPFTARPVPGALVSTPLEWTEVRRGLELAAFTIRTVPERMARKKRDPMVPVLDDAPDLHGALERLLGRLGRKR